MGRGSYTAADWAKLSTGRSLHTHSSYETIFTNTEAKPQYTSRSIPNRRSMDSSYCPNSTPVIIGFDNTASMGYLAHTLATQSLQQIAAMLYTDDIVTDPHVLCAAVGDSKSDRYPLQVTQFEADERVLMQLLDFCIEGGGGGNNGESYHLLWYFARYHTLTDAYEKRRQKGYLFTIGNDRCHPILTESEINRVFSDQTDYPLSNEELLRQVGERYEVFHIHIIDPRTEDAGVYRSWESILKGRVAVIHPDQVSLLPQLIMALIRITGGLSVSQALSLMPTDVAVSLSKSIAGIDMQHTASDILRF